jgi:hypothetical protein
VAHRAAAVFWAILRRAGPARLTIAEMTFGNRSSVFPLYFVLNLVASILWRRSRLLRICAIGAHAVVGVSVLALAVAVTLTNPRGRFAMLLLVVQYVVFLGLFIGSVRQSGSSETDKSH